MKVENLKFDYAVFEIPINAVKVSMEVEVYESGKIEKIHADFCLEDIRDAFNTFEETVAGDFPLFALTDKGRQDAERLMGETNK